MHSPHPEGYVKSRTALVNQTRGLLAEYGIIIRQGICAVRNQLPALITDEKNELSGLMRRNLTSLYESLCFLDDRVHEQDKLLKVVAKENEACQRLMKVPGIGIMTATILLTIAGVASNFKNGREFAAFLGLVPRQNSTGGKVRLLGISKRGDCYTRTLLIHGARAALCRMISGYTPEYRRNLWAVELAARRGKNKASVALANKTARVVWSLLAQGGGDKHAA